MKRLCLVLSLLAAGVGGPVLANTTAVTEQSPANQTIDSIMVIVNDQIITTSQFKQSLAAAKQQYASANRPLPPTAQLNQLVLDNLIDERLQLSMANRFGIKASNTEVTNMVLRIAKQHQLTLEQLKAELVKQGTNYAAFRQQIEKQVIVGKVQQQALAGKVTVNDKLLATTQRNYRKAQAAKQAYHITDFIVPLTANSSKKQQAKALAQAQQLKQQLHDDVSLADIAHEHSDLGFRTQAELPDLFAALIPTLQQQGVAGPVLAANGYHVLKLLATRGANAHSLSNDKLRQLAFQTQYQAELKQWLAQIRANAYIKIVQQP